MPALPPCPASDICYVYLVRHGATANNDAQPPRLQGRQLDVELSVEGRRQAEATSTLLASERLNAVYTSPLRRARETAEIIGRPHRLGAQVIDALIECDVGRWEGRSWQDIEREDVEAYRRFHEDAGVHPYAGGENLCQVLARVRPALWDLMSANLGRILAVVGHNVVNRVYLAHLLSCPLAKARELPQHNCGVNVVCFRDGKPSVVVLNSTLHLPTW